MACYFLTFVDLYLGDHPFLAPSALQVNAEEPMGYVKLKTFFFSSTTNIIKIMCILVCNLELICYIGGPLCSYSCCALTQTLNTIEYNTLMSVKCIEFVLRRLVLNVLFLEIIFRDLLNVLCWNNFISIY